MQKVRPHHVISTITVAGLAFVALTSPQSNGPLFSNLDNFILFAEEEVTLEQGVQVSSGDVGSNSKLNIQKEVIVNGNLFADKLTIDKDTQINGNASYNTSDVKKESEILGNKTSPISLPISNLPAIPALFAGNQDFKFTGEDNTLPQGNYRNITLEKDSKLTLTGGTYNITSLFLKENSTLIFSQPTILNIKDELKGQQKIAILPATNTIKPQDLTINYPSTKPVEFGKTSFFNFRLIAPNAQIHLGEAITLRGQVVAGKIKVEKGSVLSREEFFAKDTDPDKIITVEGEKFPVNEMVVVLRDSATFGDAQNIADLVKGRITGFIPTPPIYKIEVAAEAPEELDALINFLLGQQNPKVLFVAKNIGGGLQ